MANKSLPEGRLFQHGMISSIRVAQRSFTNLFVLSHFADRLWQRHRENILNSLRVVDRHSLDLFRSQVLFHVLRYPPEESRRARRPAWPQGTSP